MANMLNIGISARSILSGCDAAIFMFCNGAYTESVYPPP